MKLVKIHQTSLACPSQWDAWTDTGKYVYMRYRHGRGTVRVFDSIEQSTQKGKLTASFQHGGTLDGDIDLNEFCHRAGLKIASHADVQALEDDNAFTS